MSFDDNGVVVGLFFRTRTSAFWKRFLNHSLTEIWAYLNRIEPRRTPRLHRNVCTGHNSSRGWPQARIPRLNHIWGMFSRNWQMPQSLPSSTLLPKSSKRLCLIYALCITLSDVKIQDRVPNGQFQYNPQTDRNSPFWDREFSVGWCSTCA